MNGGTTGLETIRIKDGGGASNSLTLTNVAASTKLEMNNDGGQVAVTYTGTTGETTVSLKAEGVKDTATFQVGNGVENLAITTATADSTFKTVNDAGTDLVKITVAGDKALTITDALEAEVKTFDASTASGNINVSTANTADAVSFKFGSGNDKLQVLVGGLTAADVIEMGEGEDTLAIKMDNNDNFATDISSKTKGVEVLEVNTTAGGDSVTLNVGATKLGVTKVVLDGAAAGDAFTVSNVANNTTLTMKSNHATTGVTLETNTAADTIALVLDGVTTSGTTTLTGIETVNVTSQKDSAGNTNSLNSVSATSATALNLAGSAALVGGTITLAANAAVNASAYTGDLTGTTFGAALKSYSGGSGKDEITLAAGNLTTGNTFAGGTGTDKLSVTASTNQNGGVLAVTGFETIAITTAAGANQSFTGDFRNVTDLTTLELAATTAASDDVVISRIDGNATVKATTGFDNLSITLNTGTTHKLETNGNIATLTLDAGATDLNIKANGNTTFTTISATGLTTITASGASTLNLGTLPTTVTKIDGSAMTGALTADLTTTSAGTLLGGSAGDTLTDGAGNDNINGNAGADVISLAGGGNDIVWIDSTAESRGASFAAANTSTVNMDVVTSFTGNGASAGDQFRLSTTSDAYGTNLTFTTSTTANINAVSIGGGTADYADLSAVITAINTAIGAGTASTSSIAQVYVVTVDQANTGTFKFTGNAVDGVLMFVNNGTAAISADDMVIDITGVSGSLHASDFIFA